MNIIQEQFHVFGLGPFASILLHRPVQIGQPWVTLVPAACVWIDWDTLNAVLECTCETEHAILHSVN